MANRRKLGPLPEHRAMAKRLELTRIACGKASGPEMIGKLDISRTSYSAWEGGRARISLDAALLLCKRYKLSLDWFYFGHVGKIDNPTVRSRLIELMAEHQIDD